MTAALRRLPVARPVADVDEASLGAVAKGLCVFSGVLEVARRAPVSTETAKLLEHVEATTLGLLQEIGERRASIARSRRGER